MEISIRFFHLEYIILSAFVTADCFHNKRYNQDKNNRT